MKTRIISAILLGIINLFPLFAFAQTESVDDVLKDIEAQRIEKLEAQLGISIPTETDNPNHIVSFKDPSGKGVKLEIDGQGYKTILSPYTLPSLGIGDHVLSFKFVDKEETAQTLEENIVIIPRPPVINAPTEITLSKISLSGTAVAGSTVELFISGETINHKKEATVTSEGKWDISFENGFTYAIYTVIGRAKKNGYSSNLSEPLVFEIDETNKPKTTGLTNHKSIFFDFGSITLDNIVPTIKSNPHLIILIVLPFILGVVFSGLLKSVTRKKTDKEREGKFFDLMNGKNKNEKEHKKEKKENSFEPSSMTLRERFEKAGYKLPRGKDGKVVSKAEFLERFKEQDPDNVRGKEKKEKKAEKKEKKDVAVSLVGKVAKKH